jgi:hypothetical protein
MVAWGDVPTWLAVAGGVVGGVAALRQFSLQREQLRDQQQVIAAQARLLERQQAIQVEVIVQTINGAAAGVLPAESAQSVHMAVVTNNSSRPIRNLACRMTPDGLTPAPATVVGELRDWQIASQATAETLVLRERADHWRIVPPGHRCGFVFPFDTDTYPNVVTEARFADDAGVDWEIDHDLRLVRLEPREEW